MPNVPEVSAKIQTDYFYRFTESVRRHISAPHAEIKAELDAEREAICINHNLPTALLPRNRRGSCSAACGEDFRDAVRGRR